MPPCRWTSSICAPTRSAESTVSVMPTAITWCGISGISSPTSTSAADPLREPASPFRVVRLPVSGDGDGVESLIPRLEHQPPRRQRRRRSTSSCACGSRPRPRGIPRADRLGAGTRSMSSDNGRGHDQHAGESRASIVAWRSAFTRLRAQPTDHPTSRRTDTRTDRRNWRADRDAEEIRRRGRPRDHR